MSEQSLPSKAIEIYSDRGLLQLINSTQSSIRNRFRNRYRNRYRSAVELLRRVKTDTHQIDLNGVTVPVEASPIDKYLHYEPPYPTEDNPEYEYTEVESLKTYAQKGDDVVVIGGGLGVTAVVASRVTDGEVTVFEQSKPTYQILTRTIELNDCGDNVNPELKTVGETGGSNFTHQPPSDIDRTSPSELPYADVYEMDCEGVETTILRKMDVKPPTLLIETHSNHDIVCDILDEIGYDVIEVVDDGKNQYPSCTHIRAQLSE